MVDMALFPDVSGRATALRAVRHAAMAIWVWSAYFALSGLLVAALAENLIGATIVLVLATVSICLGFTLVVRQNVATAVAMIIVIAGSALQDGLAHHWIAVFIEVIIVITVVNGLRGALALRSGRVVSEIA